ncbi:MAG: 50S ribosomal protein L10 [Nitrososphaeria archaeon]
MQRQVRRTEKTRGVDRLTGVISSHHTILSFRLRKVRSSVLHQVRRILRGQAEITVCKKTLFSRAAEKANKLHLKRLVEDEKEPLGFIFTDQNPFKVNIMLEKSKILMHAKAGDKADIEVVIPESNTGLTPGPVLSDFGKLKIPTKIEGGNIWIARDTLVAEKGETISPALASLLAKMDIGTVRRGLETLAAFDGDTFIPGSDLRIDIEAYRRDLVQAVSEALNLSLNSAYPTRENMAVLISTAERQALTLGVTASYPSPETVLEILRRAHIGAQALSRAVRSGV